MSSNTRLIACSARIPTAWYMPTEQSASSASRAAVTEAGKGADARKKARQILSDIEHKADPAAALPKPQKRTPSYSIKSLWPDYRKAKADRRSIREIERDFNRHILPAFGERAADKVARGEITRFIDEIAQAAPVMARNVLSQFSSFYSWALPRLDHLPGNPCRDAGRPRAPKARDRVLSEEEIGALWHVLEGEGKPFGPAIRLLMLTGQRRNEVFERRPGGVRSGGKALDDLARAGEERRHPPGAAHPCSARRRQGIAQGHA